MLSVDSDPDDRQRLLRALVCGPLLLIGLSLTVAGCDLFGSDEQNGSKTKAPSVPSFTKMGADLEGVRNGSSSIGDVNNDSHLDLLLTGAHDTTLTARVYLGDGSGGFSRANAGLTGVEYSSSGIGDVDGDGNADLVITGFDGTANPDGTPHKATTLYLGNGQGDFEPAQASLPGVSEGTTVFRDANGDGNLDLLLAGSDTSLQASTTLYLGNGQGDFTDAGTELRGISQGSASFGDVDGNGTVDLLLTGGATRLYLGSGQGTFAAANANLIDLAMSTASMGDVDNDGTLDLLVSGFGRSGAITRLYLGTGNGSYKAANAGLTGLVRSSSAIGDLNNDGRLDLLLLGDDGDTSKALLYLGHGDGSFAKADAEFNPVFKGVSSLGDVDADGDLDVLITGDGTATLYENHSADGK